MCAAPTTTTTTSSVTKSTTPGFKSRTTNPNQKRNKHFRGGKPNATAGKSGSAQKPNQQSRNEKRARWAKKNRPVAKPIVKRGPVKEYLCDCHGELARKPKAGTKVTVQDPESKKMKDKFLGLGKWRCATTGKRCKATPQAPKAKETPQTTGTFGGLKIDPFPGKLQTPVLIVPPPTEVKDAATAV
jgi:hypothetical protein